MAVSSGFAVPGGQSVTQVAPALRWGSSLTPTYELIQRNLEKLNQISICATMAQIHEGAGRPTNAYYLNEKQSIFICMKADTATSYGVRSSFLKSFCVDLSAFLTS